MSGYIIYTGIFGEPDSNAAGKRVFGNALVLESLGYKVFLLGKTQDADYSGKKTYTENIWYESYPEYGRVKYNGYIKYLEKTIITLDSKPKFIIRYGAPGLTIFDYKLIKLGKKLGIPIIADVVDWLSADTGSIIFKIVKTTDTFLEKGIFNKMSDGIIAISEYLGKYYRKTNKNVIVVPPLVDHYQKNDSANRITRIIYAGSPFRIGKKVENVHRIKDRLDLAVAAFAEIISKGNISFSFEIFGVTKEDYLVAYPQHREILIGTDNQIIFHGRKSMNEVQKEINSSDFTILLRERNRATMAGFPTKVVESISCGTPVITTKTSDLESFIHEGYNGFFVSIENMNMLVEKLIGIIAMGSDVKQNMKNNCLEGKDFLPERYIPQFNDLLISIQK